MNTILPIGSVVKIMGIEKPIMIFGFLQQSGLSQVKQVAYVGVPYPEGNIGPQAQIGFQRGDIEEVLFEGYRTEAFQPWGELIERLTDEKKKTEVIEQTEK